MKFASVKKTRTRRSVYGLAGIRRMKALYVARSPGFAKRNVRSEYTGRSLSDSPISSFESSMSAQRSPIDRVLFGECVNTFSKTFKLVLFVPVIEYPNSLALSGLCNSPIPSESPSSLSALSSEICPWSRPFIVDVVVVNLAFILPFTSLHMGGYVRPGLYNLIKMR